MLLQDIPSSDSIDQGDEDVWETVGAVAERCASPHPATKEDVPEPTQEETGAMESQASVEEGQDPSPAIAVEQPEEAHTESGAASEAGIVDMTSIHGGPTVTVVRSTLQVCATLE
jgi:hypothetical protein